MTQVSNSQSANNMDNPWARVVGVGAFGCVMADRLRQESDFFSTQVVNIDKPKHMQVEALLQGLSLLLIVARMDENDVASVLQIAQTAQSMNILTIALVALPCSDNKNSSAVNRLNEFANTVIVMDEQVWHDDTISTTEATDCGVMCYDVLRALAYMLDGLHREALSECDVDWYVFPRLQTFGMVKVGVGYASGENHHNQVLKSALNSKYLAKIDRQSVSSALVWLHGVPTLDEFRYVLDALHDEVFVNSENDEHGVLFATSSLGCDCAWMAEDELQLLLLVPIV